MKGLQHNNFKCIVLSLVFSLLFVSFNSKININADSKDDYMNFGSIDELYDAYLKNNNAYEREDLSIEESNELSLLIQEYKELHYNIEQSKATRTKLSDFTGGIFLHFDSTTSSWNHGHAGIGYGTGVIEILNPNSTVQKYGPSRVREWYGKNTGGFYTVRGARAADNSNAANNAYNKIGTGYWLIGNTGEFGGYTCSGLVAISWYEAGFDIGNKAATPKSLENNSKTILQFLWEDVTY